MKNKPTLVTYPFLVAALFVMGVALPANRIGAQEHAGKRLYTQKCAPCHQTGLLGAPKTSDSAAWQPRIAKGKAALLKNVISGLNNMPPKGGNPGTSDEDIGRALDYMLAQTGAGKASQAAGAEVPESAPASSAASETAKAAPPPSPPAKIQPAASRPSSVNAFNRLMKPPSERNPPPTKDGIHDPTNEGTHILQAPKTAFSALPKSLSGNRVDWVKALDEQKIAPRYELTDSGKQPVIMDLNIVREVKGSMPDVVYPHKQHTQWLDCSNCHPAIFKPQKGANRMSMANILLGKQCGVCHGKVAFPVGECRKCHSRKKPKGAATQ